MYVERTSTHEHVPDTERYVGPWTVPKIHRNSIESMCLYRAFGVTCEYIDRGKKSSGSLRACDGFSFAWRGAHPNFQRAAWGYIYLSKKLGIWLWVASVVQRFQLRKIYDGEGYRQIPVNEVIDL